MDIEYDDESLELLESDPRHDAGFGRDVVKAFRKRIQVIRPAPDERDFRALKSLHFEKLQRQREGQYSMRLNDQWRLILRFVTRERGKTVVVIAIDDYH
jgi:proteic killer suppression protein